MDARFPFTPEGWLPRLEQTAYRGGAVVFWTHTIDGRATGWLSDRFHAAFREVMLHAALRENLYCPIYTLMPGHLHLLWMGIASDSDQQLGTRFFRNFLRDELKPHRWQHQTHDHVLRDHERRKKTFMMTAQYIAMNPVRARLVSRTDAWAFTGCMVPGYPDLRPLEQNFWDKYWRFYEAAINRGLVGKVGCAAPRPAA